MSLSVSNVVEVNVSVSPTLPQETVNLGALVLFGASPRLPFGARLQYFASLTAVGAVFSTSDPEYIAAEIWFSQSPSPSEIGIARRFTSATNGELLGSTNYTGTLAAFQAINSGSLDINVDGTAETLTAINLSTVSSLANVAALVQTALQVVKAGATVTYNGSQFIVRSGTTGGASSVGYATTAGSGTDLGPLLGLTAAQQGVITPGVAVETTVQSIQNVRTLDQTWYGLALTSDVEDDTDIENVAAWAEANFVLFGYSSPDSAIPTAATNDLATLLMNGHYTRTMGQWDNQGTTTSPYDHLSIMACLMTTDFTQPNASKTLKFKNEPGEQPINVTAAQAQYLTAKNINFYTNFGDTSMFTPGICASGMWVDERYGLDALNLQIQNNVFAYLISRPSKVAQTDRDLTNIVQQIALACQQFVNAGFLAPGYWQGADVGSVNSGDYLKSGYYIYMAPVASQTLAQRATRIAPPCTVICCGAGAIHNIVINLTFQQ